QRAKPQISRWTRMVVRNETLWRCLHPLVAIPTRISRQRQAIVKQRQREREQARLEEEIKRLTPDLVVLEGPFKGLKYPFVRSVGSTCTPKLLGTYEAELH